MLVFISHSNNDKPFYSSLCLALDGADVARWDPTELTAGESVAEQLRRAIEQCELCIFLATARSLGSQWCLAELGAFWGAGKKVIVYLADSDVKESDLPPQFHGTLWTRDAKQLLTAVKQKLHEVSKVTNNFNADSIRYLAEDSVKTGVQRIFRNRLAMGLSHDALNEKISSAGMVNIASLVFNVQQSRDLKKSLAVCVKRGGRVRILLSDPNPVLVNGGSRAKRWAKSTDMLWPLRLRQYAERDLDHHRMPSQLNATLDFLADLHKDLCTQSEQDVERFEVRLLSRYVMYTFLMQIDEMMIVTFYSNKQQGNGSPTLRLDGSREEASLFSLFKEEFEYLWERATPSSNTA